MIVELAKGTCNQAPEIGTCQNYENRWYFDTIENRCKQFYYSGCGGNDNNFINQEDCLNKCRQSTTQQAAPFKTHEEINVAQPRGAIFFLLKLHFFYSHLNIMNILDIFVPPNCEDNVYFPHCNLIVKAKNCGLPYYAKFCCRSCMLAGQGQYSQNFVETSEYNYTTSNTYFH